MAEKVFSKDPALQRPNVSQACILCPLVCLLLTTGFHSLPRLSRDLQMSGAKVAFMTDRPRGWNAGGGKSDRAAKFGVSISPRSLGARQSQAPRRSQPQPRLHLTALWSKWGSRYEHQDVYSKSLLSDFLSKPPLPLNSRPMGRENNQGFELTNGLGNLSRRRPLTHSEGRHNPDLPRRDQSQLLIHGSQCPVAECEKGIRNGVLQKLPKEPHLLKHAKKLTPSTNRPSEEGDSV